MVGVADQKLKTRRALHQRAAVSVVYTPVAGPARSSAITARYHTRQAPAATIDSQGAGIITDATRIIFNEEQLAAPLDGGAAITLDRGDQIEFPDYGITVELDTLAPRDGPIEEIWNATLVE